MGESAVRIVRLGEITKLENADTLGLTLVDGGYPVVVKLGDWSPGDLAVYIPVDSLVPVKRPEFDFLAKEAKADGRARIKAKRLRGTFSMGLLVPPPITGGPAWSVGDLAGPDLGVTRYLPPSEDDTPAANRKKSRRSETYAYERRTTRRALIAIGLVLLAASVTDIQWLLLASPVMCGLAWLDIRRNRIANKKPRVPFYDIEGLRKYSGEFTVGEPVHITEKIHGCSMVAVHTGKRFFVRSRHVWRDRDDPSDIFCKIARKYGLEDALSQHPNFALFGEVYGSVQDLHYGVSPEEGVRFAAFDVLDLNTMRWLDPEECRKWCHNIGVPVVPTLYTGPWSQDLVKLAEGVTTMVGGATHCREGIVIKPASGRWSLSLNSRLCLKLHGQQYLLRKEST